MVKRLLLGTAAGFVAIAGAQGADMPVKAKPVQYVKICTLYGDGYYYIPGSDTCIKIGGYVRLDVGWNAAGGRTVAYSGTSGAQDRTVAQFSTRARAAMYMDTRTQSQYGTLRTVTQVYFQNQDQAESFNLSRAFIQWAGFSLGRMQSFSDVWSIGDAFNNIEQQQTGSDTGTNGVNAIAYTWDMGNGVTFTAGADERRNKNLTNLSVNSVLKVGAEPTDFHQGEKYPDPYLAFKINQSWGYFGISGAIHDVNASYYTDGIATAPTSGVPGYSCTAVAQGGGLGPTNTPLTTCGHPSDKVGFVVMAGGEIKLPQFGPGDRIGADVRYSVGAAGWGGGSSLASVERFGAGNNVAMSWITDGVFVNGSGIELTTAWAVQAGYNHHWNSTFETTLIAGYSNVSYGSTAQTYFSDALGCTASGSGAAKQTSVNVNSGTNCNPNFQFLEAGLSNKWTPVPGFAITSETVYSYIWTGMGGTALNLSNAGANPIIGARPAGIYALSNNGLWSNMLRVNRSFNAAGD